MGTPIDSGRVGTAIALKLGIVEAIYFFDQDGNFRCLTSWGSFNTFNLYLLRKIYIEAASKRSGTVDGCEWRVCGEGRKSLSELVLKQKAHGSIWF